MKSACIRLLLVDDHATTREGLKALLERQPDMQVAGEAVSGSEGLAAYQAHRPDVTLMDGHMPGGNGLEASRAILAEFSEACILFFSTTEEMFVRAREAGVKACLLKEEPTSRLLDLIRRVHRENR